jgi:hypothetical protein
VNTTKIFAIFAISIFLCATFLMVLYTFNTAEGMILDSVYENGFTKLTLLGQGTVMCLGDQTNLYYAHWYHIDYLALADYSIILRVYEIPSPGLG